MAFSHRFDPTVLREYDIRGIIGRTLHTLVGYSDQPTGMQLLVYLAVLLITVLLMRVTRTPPAHGPVATAAEG